MSLQTPWIRKTNWNILEQSFRRSQSSPSTARGRPPTCSAYLLAQTHINSRKHKTKQAKNVKKRKTVTSQTQFVGHLLWGKFMYIPHDRLQTTTRTHICVDLWNDLCMSILSHSAHILCPFCATSPLVSSSFDSQSASYHSPWPQQRPQWWPGPIKTLSAHWKQCMQLSHRSLRSLRITYSHFNFATLVSQCKDSRSNVLTVSPHLVKERTGLDDNEHEAASNIAWSFLTNVLQPLFKIKTWQVQTNDTRACPISISSCILNSWLIISAFTVGKLASHLKPPTINSVGCTDVTPPFGI